MGSPYHLLWQGLLTLSCEILTIPAAATTSIQPESCHTVQMYMECLPSVISVMSEFCVLIQHAAAAGIARSFQLSSPLAGQAVQYFMAKAGGTARLSQFKSTPLRPSPPAMQGRTPCWVKALRLSFSVSLQSQMVGRVHVDRLFWAQMALASLVALSGPEKVSNSIFRDHPFQWLL